jgi:hypothetical protein
MRKWQSSRFSSLRFRRGSGYAGNSRKQIDKMQYLGRKIQSPNRHAEQEPQLGHDAVAIADAHAGLVLADFAKLVGAGATSASCAQSDRLGEEQRRSRQLLPQPARNDRVFRVGATPHLNTIELGRHGRSRSSVWHYAGANSFRTDRMHDLRAHPTVKPVAMIDDAMTDCTRRIEIVLDTFCGSGDDSGGGAGWPAGLRARDRSRICRCGGPAMAGVLGQGRFACCIRVHLWGNRTAARRPEGSGGSTSRR